MGAGGSTKNHGNFAALPPPQGKYFPDLVQRLPNLRGKVFVITGCTSGTGLTSAIALARLNARVVMLNRPSERAQQALQKVRAAASQAKSEEKSDVEHIDCDLMDFSSVRAAAATLRERYSEGVDVLCNNAGVMSLGDRQTKDGYDIQMQVNHLSHFLLTSEIFSLLEAAAERTGEARVVNHSSLLRVGKHLQEKYMSTVGEAGLGGDGLSGRNTRYQQTKLANAVFTYAMKDKLDAKGSKVKALVAHPGIARTQLVSTTVKDGAMPAFLMNAFMAMNSMAGDDGACGIMACMCLPDAASGDFWGPGKTGMAKKGPAIKITPTKKDQEWMTADSARQGLWEWSEKAVGQFSI